MKKLSKNKNNVLERRLERVGWMSMAVNVLLILLNSLLGWLLGSIASTAEAVHNLVDVVGSVAILIGLKLSRRKSNNFPYGLYPALPAEVYIP
jgi:divalent metal cation (Fe/Co/Zn/Cd) transporter